MNRGSSSRPKFLAGLESGDKPTVEAAISALMTLPRDASPEHLVPALEPCGQPGHRSRELFLAATPGGPHRTSIGRFLRDQARGRRCDGPPSVAGAGLLLVEKAQPKLASRLDAGTDEDLGTFRGRLPTIDLSAREIAERGVKLLREPRLPRGPATKVPAHSGPTWAGSSGVSPASISSRRSPRKTSMSRPYRTSLIETEMAATSRGRWSRNRPKG